MRKQFGLSLVELMISITLGLILMTGVMKLFISSKVVFSTQQGLSRIQETGRLAIDFLSHDINEAAYYGCTRPTSGGLPLQGTVVPSATSLHRDYGIGIVGYDSVSALPEGAGTLGSAHAVSNSASLYANILVVRSAAQQGLILNAANTPTALTTFSNLTADSAGCISGVCPNAVAVVADCYKARVFKVSSLSSNNNIVTVNHSDSWGGSDQIIESFVNGAEVLPFNTNVYFLADSASGKGTSLWQRHNDDPAFELLEGVEQMRVTYSIKDQVAYKAASAITNWEDVWSVRIELLVRSLEDNILDEKQPYSFADKATVTPDDRRMRQVFTSTAAIRSRLTLN